MGLFWSALKGAKPHNADEKRALSTLFWLKRKYDDMKDKQSREAKETEEKIEEAEREVHDFLGEDDK